jgi:hypothetical protein
MSKGAKAEKTDAAHAALFSIYFNVFQLRPDHGFPAWAALVREYREKEKTLPESEHVFDRILPLPDAVSSLAKLKADPAIVLHAVAALVLGYWLVSKHEVDRVQSQEFRGFVNQLLPGEDAGALFSSVNKAASADDAYQKVYGALAGLSGFTFRIITAEFDADMVSRFEAEAARPKRPGELLEPMLVRSDPRGWSSTLPQTFEFSYQTEDPSPADPFVNPPKANYVTVLGTPWKGRLFEQAMFEVIPGVKLTEVRNTLDIDFRVNRKAGDATLQYSLFEALSNKVYGLVAQGGLDVDSGSGSVKLDQRLKLRAGKNIRFSNAAPFELALNLLSLPFLFIWVSLLLLTSLFA